jgi:hypothetical protein
MNPESEAVNDRLLLAVSKLGKTEDLQAKQILLDEILLFVEQLRAILRAEKRSTGLKHMQQRKVFFWDMGSSGPKQLITTTIVPKAPVYKRKVCNAL